MAVTAARAMRAYSHRIYLLKPNGACAMTPNINTLDRELTVAELTQVSGGWSVDMLVELAKAQKNAGSGAGSDPKGYGYGGATVSA
jgi:hypothetical protein